MPSRIIISTNKDRLDTDWMVKQIWAAHWGGWMSEKQIRTAIDKSLVFGAYTVELIGRPQMVGFARFVTDTATFSSLTEMLVSEDYQHQGVGSMLLAAAMDHPSLRGTICVLHAREHLRPFYEKAGFTLEPAGIMKRLPQ